MKYKVTYGALILIAAYFGSFFGIRYILKAGIIDVPNSVGMVYSITYYPFRYYFTSNYIPDDIYIDYQEIINNSPFNVAVQPGCQFNEINYIGKRCMVRVHSVLSIQSGLDDNNLRSFWDDWKYEIYDFKENQ